MSTARSAARARTIDTIHALEANDPDPTVEDYADSVIDAVLPLINDWKQLLGVPDDSILIDRRNTVYKIYKGYLVNILTGWRADKSVLDDHGPLTVIAMP